MKNLDTYLKVSSPSTFIALSALTVLFISLVIWFFFGTVTDTATLKGVIFPSHGTVNVNLPNKGLVRSVFVHKGDKVVKGQQLALVSVDGSYSVVSSPANGEVLSYLSEGESFEPFKGIVSIFAGENSATVNTVVALADFKQSRDIKPGQVAQCTPTYDSRERIGYIKGRVHDIIPYPISRREMEDFFENKSIVDEIFPESGAVFFLRINLDTDPEDPSSLKWSFKGRKDLEAGVGTYCNIQVIVRSRSMFEYLMENVKEARNTIGLWLE